MFSFIYLLKGHKLEKKEAFSEAKVSIQNCARNQIKIISYNLIFDIFDIIFHI